MDVNGRPRSFAGAEFSLTITPKLYFADVRKAIGVSKDCLGEDKRGMSSRCIITYRNSKNHDNSQCKLYYGNIRMIFAK